MKTPFHVSKKKVRFPWKPTSDRAFIWPSDPPETFVEGGLIHIPDYMQEDYAEGWGILLAIGPGFFNNSGKWKTVEDKLIPGTRVVYDINVPWRAIATGVDEKEHLVVLCGAADILAVEC